MQESFTPAHPMKSQVRIGTLVIALLFSGWLTGCVNQPSYSGQRVRSARDFEIVETSTKRTLSTREMVYLKEKVEDYLEKEGVTESGDYYVKIYLGEEDGVNEGEWVVVRYTREPAVRLNLVASYPNYYDPYRSTFAYDYYPFPHYGFGRLSFQYYDYPYYGYYYPGFRRPHHHGRGHHGDRDGKPDRDRDDDRDPPPNDGRPSGALKPSFKPSFVPANVNYYRGNRTAPAFDARVADDLLRPRLEPRPRSRTRNTDPVEPRPAPRGAPDFSARQPVTTDNSGAFKPSRIRPMATVAQPSAPRFNQPDQENTTPVRRAVNVRERQPAPAPGPSNRPVREVRSNTNTVSRPSPAAAFKPSAPRAQPAPAPAPVRSEPARSYSAPASRSESRSESESSSSQRVDRNDNGRQEPER